MSQKPPALSLPPRISRLSDLAANLWWSWYPEASTLFASMDPSLWHASVSNSTPNPVKLLYDVDPQRLHTLAHDPSFLTRYDAVIQAFDTALSGQNSWVSQYALDLTEASIAYFSAEFGLHSSLPIYSGGLGVLAGDHCKEASDLGLPFVGIGLLYQQGYFHQRVSADGHQEAVYEDLDRSKAPITLVLTPEGKPQQVSVQIADREVHITVWQIQVGRISLYLMDTDVEENAAEDRTLSARLYDGDQEMRLRQEIVLGIGGVRILRALGIAPRVWHLNEGHASFVMIERLRELAADGLTFSAALKQVQKSSVFTTHTPVPAGHDAFPFELVEQYLPACWDELRIDREEFFDLARYEEPWGERFHMTVLALRLSQQRNAVSQIHGTVSRQMWQSLWPETSQSRTGQTSQTSVDQVPIIAVTNGIHVPTWLAPSLYQLFSAYLGSDWLATHDNPQLWQRVAAIPDEELWAVHVQLRHDLIRFIGERARHLWQKEQRDTVQILAAGSLLDPDALTIGFARRFATYKRANLLLKNLARLQSVLQGAGRPVQIIFAGKAHPADEPGQDLIRQVYEAASDYKLGGRIAFIENYDMHLAQFLVRGVDVWLNNPIAPQEASGTSGEKAALNGIPNLSIADGWWDEAYNGKNGWIVDPVDPELSEEERDERDADALYQLLAEEIVPLFYERDADGVPYGWLQVMKETLISIPHYFSTRRMVKEYVEKLYLPALRSV